jgi:septum site-determining protein MinC
MPGQRSMRFLGRSYMAFVFTPDPPVAQWVARLDEWLSRSPGFFVGRPIVLDLANVKLSRSEILNLIIELLARSIRVIGLENADVAELGPELPPLLSGRPASVQEMAVAAKQEAKRPPPKQPASLLIEHPVRSGQSVVFLEGDVSVLGSVASGAEIAAGGSIHVYGTLRGRAMAGHMGNPRARIFCQKIEAELLAIDGRYRTADEIDPALRGRPTQAWLDGDKMMLTALN